MLKTVIAKEALRGGGKKGYSWDPITKVMTQERGKKKIIFLFLQKGGNDIKNNILTHFVPPSFTNERGVI